jgi:Putative manganese efflux pump
VLALLLVALSLGLSNFAASVGIGVAGVSPRTRLRVGVIFGLFETGMPILGLLLGHGLAAPLGRAAHWIGAALLIATGTYALVQAVAAIPASSPPGPASTPGGCWSPAWRSASTTWPSALPSARTTSTWSSPRS